MQLTLINEGVMLCRIDGIIKKFARNDIPMADKMIKDTLYYMQHAVENEMSPDLTMYVFHTLTNMLNEVEMGCNMSAYNRARGLSFMMTMAV